MHSKAPNIAIPSGVDMGIAEAKNRLSSSITDDGSLALAAHPCAHLIRAGHTAGVGHLAVDDDAGRGHDTEAHDLGDIGDLLQFDLDAGLFRRLCDGVGGDLAVAAAGTENFELFHSLSSFVELQHPPLPDSCTGGQGTVPKEQ